MKYVNTAVKKLDADALVQGKPVYTDDIASKDCLIIKLLRSPHAHAKIVDINTTIAEKVPGVELILTYKNAPRHRYTSAGQTYPEWSPYDRVLCDDTMRYVGDVAAIVAADTEKHAEQACKLIQVKYDVLEAVLDFEKAKDNAVRVHDDDSFAKTPFGYAPERNLICTGSENFGNFEEEYEKCAYKVDCTYYTPAQQQCMMETFRSYAYMEYSGRLTIVSSTQVPFHARRHVATMLGIPYTKVRIIKPRIGGGFGAKQTSVSEFYPAAVTWITGKPSKLLFTRQESFACSNSRHQMRIRVQAGCDAQGHVTAINMQSLSNTGAYGEHGSTVVGLVGHKTIPLYNKLKGGRFSWDVVYTNIEPAAAFRGYGATQGTFALESTINQLAEKADIDAAEMRLRNIAEAGAEVFMTHEIKYLNSTGLRGCITRGMELSGWKEKPHRWITPEGKIRGMGMAICMQGSGIANVDTASVELRLEDFGFYTLMIGATDMGTGCDTIFAQMVADSMNCPLEKIMVHGVDTDVSPYDPGSYASASTYVTGMAVVKACDHMHKLILEEASRIMDCPKDTLEFDGAFITAESGQSLSLDELAWKLVAGPQTHQLVATASNGSPISPPPFMAGFAEVEVDPETGTTDIIQMTGVVDCGTPINRALAKVQTEGGLSQGIGLALFEDVQFQSNGKMITDSFMNYKIPTRMDTGEIVVDFSESYEPTGPFGAKSIGEVVINTPSPAIAQAVCAATGVRVTSLPVTPEKILMEMAET